MVTTGGRLRACGYARPGLIALVGFVAAAIPAGAGEGRMLVFVRSTQPYERARGDLLAVAPDGVHMPQLSAEPDEAARQEAELRAAGVRYLFRYKDLFTRTPDSLRRMYDRWEEYTGAGQPVPPRPGVPPEGWVQRGPDGEILTAYSGARWMMCPTNPHWRGIAYRSMAGLARSRADGVMCDNPMCQCYCDYCRAKFDAWMRERYAPSELREIFGLDPDQKPLAMQLPDADAGTQRVLLGACRRFWVAAMGEFFGEVVMAGGESVHGDGKFLVAPNCAGHRWFWTQTSRGVAPIWWGDAITTMYVEPGQYVGVGRRSYLCGLQETFIQRNFFDHQYAAGRLGDAESVLMKAYTGTLASPAMAELALAEGLALHGTFVIYPPRETDLGPASPRLGWFMPMVRFIQSQRSRQQRMIPAGDIAVLYCPNDMMNGFRDHYRQALEVCRALQRQHIPHRLVHRVLLARSLQERRPSVLIVPRMRCLGDPEGRRDQDLELLADFTSGGGRLLGIGEVATHSFEGRPRATPGLPWLPRQHEGALAFASFGAGLCAHLKAPVSETLPGPCALLHEALYRLLGHSPSVLAPDRWPALAADLARSPDGATYWLHLLNYDVSLTAAPGDADAVGVVREARVVVPLPDGRVARQVTLIRPEQEPASLAFEQGAEGAAVTVPELAIHALLEVETEAGQRPVEPVVAPIDPAVAGRAAASTMRLRQVGDALRFEPCPDRASVPLAQEPPALCYQSVWYLHVDRGGSLPVEVWVGNRGGGRAVDLRLIALDGTPVAEARSGSGPTGVEAFGSVQSLSLEAPGPGYYMLLAEAEYNQYRLRPRCAGACLEAHGGHALHTHDPRPIPALFFYVPGDCEAYNITAAAPQEGETCRMTVCDPDGNVVLDEMGEMDSRQRFQIEVPRGLRGRCWSFTLGPGPTGRQDDIVVALEGVPPLVAESPDRLLVPVH